MSTDRISAAAGSAPRKRKAAIDNEEVGFSTALKPMIDTGRKPRLLFYPQDDNVGLDIISLANEDDNNNAEGIEGYKTPEGEEHQLPKILSCPPAPSRKHMRPAAKKNNSRDHIM
ncbi:hypothetical protein KI387_013909, partial [Taxus chinensis]